MRRTYVDGSHWRAPYDQMPPFSGLGADWSGYPRTWPRGRSYSEIAWFRAPYDQGKGGFFQDNSLLGLGAIADTCDAYKDVEARVLCKSLRARGAQYDELKGKMPYYVGGGLLAGLVIGYLIGR